MTPHDTTILTLRARGARLHDASVRAAVHRQVATTSLSPSALSPSAILVVRTIDDPKPGVIGVDPSMTSAPAAWRDAARRRLDDLHRSAFRPAREPTPDHALSVLFDDESELIACLVRDIAAGQAHRRWWWRHRRLDRVADASRTNLITDLLLEQPRRIPAIMAHLRRWQIQLEVLTLLTRLQAAAAIAAVCRAWAVPSLIPSGVELAEEVVYRERIARSPVSTTVVSDSPEHQALRWLSAALLDSRAATVRQARAFLAWWSRQTEDASRQGPSSAEGRHSLNAPGDAPLKPATMEPEPEQFVTPRSRAIQDVSTQTEPDRPISSKPPWPTPRVPGDGDAAHSADESQPPSLDAPRTTDTGSIAEPRRADLPTDLADITPVSEPPANQTGSVRTSLGGIFYLVNVMERLGLHTRAEHLPAWQALEGIALALVIENGLDLEDDIWPCLAALSRPHDEPLGESLDAPRSALAPHLPPCGVDLPVPTSRAGIEWIRDTVPSVRRFVCDALQVPHEFESTIAHQLLVRRADVFVTTSHVDVVFPLEAATVDVRRAGLDRDPGWLPRFGRVITFHYS